MRLNQPPEDPVVGEVRLFVRYQEHYLAHALPPADSLPARDDLHEGVQTLLCDRTLELFFWQI